MKKILILFTALLVSTPLWAQNISGGTITGASVPANGGLTYVEGTVPSGSAGNDVLFGNSADHTLSVSQNNGAVVNFPVTYYLTGSAYTNATTGFTSVTGLAFPVSASRNYAATCRIVWQGSASTTGPKYQFTGPASPTAVLVGMNSIVTATTVITATSTGFSTPVANSGSVTTATNFTDTLTVSVVNGTTAGTVQLQAAANGTGTLTVQPGSYCIVQ